MAKHFDLITRLDVLKALIDKLMVDEKQIGFDVETGYLGPDRKKGAVQIDWDQQFICGFSITNDAGWARYVPVAHEFGDNLPEEKTWELMKPVLETLPSSAHNAKFEIRNLRALERKGRGPSININITDDSALASYVLAKRKSHALKELTKIEFGYQQPELSSLFPGAKKKELDALRFSVLDMFDPKVRDYACDDAVYTLALRDHYLPEIAAQRSFMYQLEMAVMWVVADMEDAGHAVDWEAIRSALATGQPFEEEMKTSAKALLSNMAGEDLSTMNLGSTPQMRDVLYNKIGLHTNRKTEKGELSTDAIALEALSREHSAVKKVLEVREVHNLTNRLGKWLNEYTGMHDGRAHASFNQVIVGSGRFSANDPAIQQLPKDWRWSVFPKVDVWNSDHWDQVLERAVSGKHYWSGNFRDFMISDPGTYILEFDYSQIELRAMAGMSQEPALLKAFNDDEDVHTLTAAMMLKIPVSAVGKRERAIGKTMNFALLYGMGEESLAERLAISYAEAEALYADYFRAFTNVTEWMDGLKAFGINYGYVETAFKRKVTIWEFESNIRSIRSKGMRLCVNAPVQGTAADIMKMAMLRAVKALKSRGWWMTKVKIINNIHDCLVFEVANDINPAELREVLQEAVVWDVKGLDGTSFPKIVADWGLGQQWGSTKGWNDEDVEFVDGHWRLVTEAPAEKESMAPGNQEVQETHQLAGEAVRESEPPALIVELSHSPDREQFGKFIGLLTENPGQTIVTVKTPIGEVDLTNYGTSLTPDEQGSISLALGGARVFYPVEEIDSESFTEGLEL